MGINSEIKPSLPIYSLNFEGDNLIDYITGLVIEPSGKTYFDLPKYPRAGVFPLDSIIIDPISKARISYSTWGTQGAVFANKYIRAITRDSYHADDYPHPVALHTDKMGNTYVIHCPDKYDRIEIESLDGKKFTTRNNKREDFFHAHLEVSSNSRYLLSYGWVWHPFQTFVLRSFQQALIDPKSLEENSLEGGQGDLFDFATEVSWATFAPNSNLLVATSQEFDDVPPKAHFIQGKSLACYDLDNMALLKNINFDFPLGKIRALDDDLVLSLHTIPRLISLKEERVVKEFPQVAIIPIEGCLYRGPDLPYAYDSLVGRLAFYNEKIFVFDISSLSKSGYDSMMTDEHKL